MLIRLQVATAGYLNNDLWRELYLAVNICK